MKKLASAILSGITALSISLSAAMPLSSFSYDYDYYFSDYFDENNYSTHKEYKTGIFSDENSRFDGCDLYTLETAEAYEGLPTLKVKYDYLVVPDSIIGSWFEKKKVGDHRFRNSYDIKLPLHTGYVFDEALFELQDSHCYDLYIMWKKVPYISITVATDREPLDSKKLAETFPDVKMKYIGRDDNGDFIYYLSTGESYTNFSEYENEVSSVLSYEDAQEILKLGSGHILSFSYYSAYEMQKVTLPEYPVYSAEYAEKAAAVFEAHGFSTTIEDSQRIIPDEPVPALEYFEMISEIREKEGAVPYMTMYESDLSTVIDTSELLESIKGDINGDGKISIADLVILQRYLIGKGKVDSCADINNDGSVDIFDMVAMRKLLIK